MRFVMVNVQRHAKELAKEVALQIVVLCVAVVTDLVQDLVGELVEVLVKALVWVHAQWVVITSSIPIKYGKQRITQQKRILQNHGKESAAYDWHHFYCNYSVV